MNVIPFVAPNACMSRLLPAGQYAPTGTVELNPERKESVEVWPQERDARHRHKIGENVRPRDGSLGEKSHRPGLTLGLLAREEVIDDVAKLFSTPESLSCDMR